MGMKIDSNGESKSNFYDKATFISMWQLIRDKKKYWKSFSKQNIFLAFFISKSNHNAEPIIISFLNWIYLIIFSWWNGDDDRAFIITWSFVQKKWKLFASNTTQFSFITRWNFCDARNKPKKNCKHCQMQICIYFLRFHQREMCNSVSSPEGWTSAKCKHISVLTNWENP